MPKSSNRGKRNTRRRAIREVEQRTGPDRSVVVHRFADGWTIRRLATPSDEFREGELLHHCLGLWPDRVGYGLYSLRDVDNHPRATFRHVAPEQREPPYDREGWTGLAAGHGDTKPIRDDYAKRIIRWSRSLPYAVHVDGGNGGFSAAVLPHRAPDESGASEDTAFAEALAEFRPRVAALQAIVNRAAGDI